MSSLIYYLGYLFVKRLSVLSQQQPLNLARAGGGFLPHSYSNLLRVNGRYTVLPAWLWRSPLLTPPHIVTVLENRSLHFSTWHSFLWHSCPAVPDRVEGMQGFPGGAGGKEPTCQCRRQETCGFDPWIRKIPWGKIWAPTPVFLPGESHGQEEPHGRTTVHRVAKSQTWLKGLNPHIALVSFCTFIFWIHNYGPGKGFNSILKMMTTTSSDKNKIFANSLFNKGLISRIYKEFSKRNG